MLRKKIRLKNLEDAKIKAQTQITLSSQDSSESDPVLENVSNIEEEISVVNKEIEDCSNNIKNLNNKLQTKINQATNQDLNITTADNTSVSGADASAPATTQTTTISKELADRLDTKLGSGFAAKCEEVASKLKCNPNDLLAMMYSESGIDPQCVGYNGACGLICFMPSILAAKGYSQGQITSMSGVQQLDVVYEFLSESKASVAGLSESQELDAGTLYAICFLPAFAKQENLCSAGDIYYSANSPLDIDKDGHISKSDLAKRLQSKFEELNKYY